MRECKVEDRIVKFLIKNDIFEEWYFFSVLKDEKLVS